MAGNDWNDEENDAIVAEYFAMLVEDIAGRRYNKAARNRAMQDLIDRPRGSIEFKHQNISAVLMSLGEARIEGYKPALNFQASLVEAVVRWLDSHPTWLMPTAHKGAETSTSSLQQKPELWVGPPPTHSNAPPSVELERLMGKARKFDPAARDARNRALGRAGEQLMLLHERTALAVAGRQDLADQVCWVSDEEGDGAGFDIASFRPDGSDRLIEVKTTNGWQYTPFHISRNELAVAEERREDWHLVRLWNFARQPTAFEIRPPLEAHVALTPTSFQAHLR